MYTCYLKFLLLFKAGGTDKNSCRIDHVVRFKRENVKLELLFSVTCYRNWFLNLNYRKMLGGKLENDYGLEDKNIRTRKIRWLEDILKLCLEIQI